MSVEKDKSDESIEDVPRYGENLGEGAGEGDKKPKIKFKTITEVEIGRFSYFDYDLFEDVYQPFALDLSKMGLTDIYPIKVHPHLLFLRLSQNNLTNASLEPLKYLQNLISLYLNRNLIKSTTLPRLERLQQLNLEHNPIKIIHPIDQPDLQILILNNTKIRQLQHLGFSSTPKLETLSVSHCRLRTTIADYALTMKHLYLSYNKITQIEGLEGLVNLKILNLRNNRISFLEGITVGLERLEYLNLRENNVIDVNELKKLHTLPLLREFIIIDNPVDDEMGNDIRPMILMYALQLKRINKGFTDKAEVEYARSLMYEVEAEEENLILEDFGEEGLLPE